MEHKKLKEQMHMPLKGKSNQYIYNVVVHIGKWDEDKTLFIFCACYDVNTANKHVEIIKASIDNGADDVCETLKLYGHNPDEFFTTGDIEFDEFWRNAAYVEIVKTRIYGGD